MTRLFISLFLTCLVQVLIAQSFTSSNLPIVKITTLTGIPDEPKVDGTMEIIYNGVGERNNVNGDPLHLSHKIGIEIRGQSSQSFDKKGYGFEFRDAAGNDEDVAFLKFPEESDFVLHGPFSDKSLVRNAMAYHLAGSIMPYAARIELVEVVLNGEYVGIYLMTENVKRGGDRVDVNKLKDDEVSGDDLTGGYIIKSDKFDDGDNAWFSNYNAIQGIDQPPFYVVHYPKSSDLVEVQYNYIRDHFHRFEDVMNSSAFEDSNSGYASMIEIQSFVDFFFVNEISRNVDGYRISTFFHKDKDSNGGLINAGPVWDFNLGFGNADYCNGWMTSGWAYDFNSVCPQDGLRIPFWWNKLIESQSFRERIRDRWDDLRANQLSDNRILEVYDSLTNLVQEAQVRNFEKFDILGTYVWPNFNVSSTYDDEVTWTRNWILSRLAWMDNQINGFPSSISNPDFVADFRLYPIPFDDHLTINFVPKVTARAALKIYDVLGREVWRTDMDLIAGRHESQHYSIDLDSGYYVFQLVQNNVTIQSGKLLSR